MNKFLVLALAYVLALMVMGCWSVAPKKTYAVTGYKVFAQEEDTLVRMTIILPQETKIEDDMIAMMDLAKQAERDGKSAQITVCEDAPQSKFNALNCPFTVLFTPNQANLHLAGK